MRSPCRARSMPGRRRCRPTAASVSTALWRQAIDYAEGGFRSPARVACDWARFVGRLKADPGCVQTISVQWRRPNEGDVIQPAGAGNNARNACRQGRRAPFTTARSPTTSWRRSRHAARFSRREDFASHRGEVVIADLDQLSRARSARLPPNGQGLTALVMLNIWRTSTQAARSRWVRSAFILLLEAARIGYAVRDTHLADPQRMRIDVAELLDKTWAKSSRPRSIRRGDSDLPKAPRPATTPSISPWSTATAWRCRSSTRSIPISARHLHRERPGSC